MLSLSLRARNKYFYNKKTGMTGWSREEVTVDDIVQQKDPKTGDTFWTNKTTGKKGWSREEVETDHGVGDDDGDEDDDVVTSGVKKLSENLGSLFSAGNVDVSAPERGRAASNVAFMKKNVHDESVDTAFFVNPATGEKHRIKGPLMKKGGYRRNWQMRWFTLNLEAGELSYYSGVERLPKQLKGVIKLSAQTSFIVPDFKAGMFKHDKGATAQNACLFELRMITEADGKPRSKFQARTEHQVELKEWKLSIEASIDAQIQRAAKKIDKQIERVSAKFDGGRPADAMEAARLTPSPTLSSPTSSPAASSVAAAASPPTAPPTASPPAIVAKSPPSVTNRPPALPGRKSAGAPRTSVTGAAPSIPARPRVPARPAEAAAPAAVAPPSTGSDPRVKKYEMMLKVGLPRGAVENKMHADGIDPAILFPDLAGGGGGVLGRRC